MVQLSEHHLCVNPLVLDMWFLFHSSDHSKWFRTPAVLSSAWCALAKGCGWRVSKVPRSACFTPPRMSFSWRSAWHRLCRRNFSVSGFDSIACSCAKEVGNTETQKQLVHKESSQRSCSEGAVYTSKCFGLEGRVGWWYVLHCLGCHWTDAGCSQLSFGVELSVAHIPSYVVRACMWACVCVCVWVRIFSPDWHMTLFVSTRQEACGNVLVQGKRPVVMYLYKVTGCGYVLVQCNRPVVMYLYKVTGLWLCTCTR